VKSKKHDSLALPYTKPLDLQASTDSVFTISPIPEGEEDEAEDDDDDDAEEEPPSTVPLLKSVQGEDTVDRMSPRPEPTESIPTSLPNADKSKEPVVSVVNGDFSWEEDRHDHTLNGITTRIPKGKLTVIVGTIGSGKSSLISAFLGEMKVIRGEVQWSEYVRYALYL